MACHSKSGICDQTTCEIDGKCAWEGVKKMKRCTRCLIPDTRPDTHFDEHGVCSACRSHDKRKLIDWSVREKELIALLDRHNGKCIVPSSGGKDSTWQALKLLELGADVTVVTATTCHLTEIGRRNIDNLSRYATTYEVSPNKEVRAKLNRLSLEMVGDISWPEHCAIFTTPFRMAKALNIPLIFYGECPQEAYGGPQGSDEARQMTRRWISEFGGFLGLRPQDFIGIEGITEKHMQDYMLPADLENCGIEAHFLGQYYEWDSHRNARVAKEAGMVQIKPSSSVYWETENLDNAQAGLHEYMGFLKYGYGRASSQLSVDIRNGLIDRESALLLANNDKNFPFVYNGVEIYDVLDRIGLDWDRLIPFLNRFTDWNLFEQTRFLPNLKDAG